MKGTRSKQHLLAAAILSAGVIFGVAMFVANPFGGHPTARAVEIREGGVPVGAASQSDAIDQASARVGFQVVAPEYVPPGVTLQFVDTALGPADVPNPFKLAALSYGPAGEAKSGAMQIRIEQPGVRFSPPDDRAERLDSGRSDVEVYRQVTANARGYWIFSRDRGFLLTVTGALAVSEDELIKMLQSLVP